MSKMHFSTAWLMLGLSFAIFSTAVTEDASFKVNIWEKGLLVEENVQVLDGKRLQKFVVPAHHQLEHVTVYLDFKLEQSVTVYHNLNTCVISSIPSFLPRPQIQEPSLQKNEIARQVLDARKAKNVFLYRMPARRLSSSFDRLHQEVQKSCKGKSLLYEPTIEFPDVLSTSDPVILPDPSAMAALQMSNSRVKRQADDPYTCALKDFAQKCWRKKQGARSCYYVLLCKDPAIHDDVSSDCLKHIRDIDVTCIPCCNKNTLAPDAFLKSCESTGKDDFLKENNCVRKYAAPNCINGGADFGCYRPYMEECTADDGSKKQYGKIEFCDKC